MSVTSCDDFIIVDDVICNKMNEIANDVNDNRISNIEYINRLNIDKINANNITTDENILKNTYTFTNESPITYFQKDHLRLLELIVNADIFDDDFKIDFYKFPLLERLTIISNRLIFNIEDLSILKYLKYLKIDVHYPTEDKYKVDNFGKYICNHEFLKYLNKYKINGNVLKDLENLEYLYYNIKTPTDYDWYNRCYNGNIINKLNKQDIKSFKLLTKLKKLYVNSAFCTGSNKDCDGNCSVRTRNQRVTMVCTSNPINNTSQIFGVDVVYGLLPQLEEFNGFKVKPSLCLMRTINKNKKTTIEKLNALEKDIKKIIDNTLKNIDNINFETVRSDDLDVFDIKNTIEKKLQVLFQ